MVQASVCEGGKAARRQGSKTARQPLPPPKSEFGDTYYTKAFN
jgi:hypothetical protein